MTDEPLGVFLDQTQEPPPNPPAPPPPPRTDVEQFLVEENRALRVAGCKMAEAALHVALESDGVHRLLLAVSEWIKVMADEGGRGERYKT